jgi:uncharacterized protein
MQVYVYLRCRSIPYIAHISASRVTLIVHIALWFTLVCARFFAHHRSDIFSIYLELIGMTWLGSIFLFFISLLALDAITLFGYKLQTANYFARMIGIVVGMVLVITAIIQGNRLPVIEDYKVSIPAYHYKQKGKVILALADLHIGTQRDLKWLELVIEKVNSNNPDLILLLGDNLEGHGTFDINSTVKVLRMFKAKLGVFAVLGNHFHYGKNNNLLKVYKDAEIGLLRNQTIEIVPGLQLSGVDDLTIHYRNKRRHKITGDPVGQTLSTIKNDSFTIFMSHTPWEVERVAKYNINLMLSGHTHGGQIWPFDYMVKTRYPFLEGHYKVKNMDLIVCRGTGLWGPPMRLFSPGEIVHITLE